MLSLSQSTQIARIIGFNGAVKSTPKRKINSAPLTSRYRDVLAPNRLAHCSCDDNAEGDKHPRNGDTRRCVILFSNLTI